MVSCFAEGAHLAQQNLVEFISVVTSAKRVDSPIAAGRALEIIRTYLRFDRVGIIIPNEKTWSVLDGLAGGRRLRGPEIFEAYLAATMLSNNVRKVFTENVADFAASPGIVARNPSEF